MKLINKILPHFNIILSGMMLTFLIIDHFNNAMQFIDNDITKSLMLIFVVTSIYNAVLLIVRQRRK